MRQERERSVTILEFPGLGNQVNVMLYLKAGRAGGGGAGLGGGGDEFPSGTG